MGLPLPVLCAGCTGWQSAMNPMGTEAHELRNLIWLFTVVAAVVWVLVMLVLAGAIIRRRPPASAPISPSAGSERRTTVAVSSAVVATVLVIGALTFESYLVTRQLYASGREPLVVRVRGYQWWWEITYADPRPARVFSTANEIHVPVGRQVSIDLAAADVIHSFWVPNLAGKQDLIPGRDNQIAFTANRAGTYRGQCAEFCGLQHAHMALVLMAEPPDKFEAWRNAQLADATAPGDAEQESGERVVTGKACAACHTIRGTSAAGTLGPDLTHLASRSYIAAGVLPMTRGSLAAWIADPQTIKPGNNMPMVSLTADELRAVSAYLASLK
jgi:cytochrome c oxidase subunit 2